VPPGRDDEPSHGLSDADEERAWQEIIAGFDAPPSPPSRPATEPGDGDGPVPRGQHYERDDDPGALRPDGPGWFGEPPTGAADPGDPGTRGPGDPGPGDRAPGDRDPLDRDPLDRDPLDPRSWLEPGGGRGGPPADRPPAYRDRDDLIVDPWSDLDTGRRGRRRTRGGSADADPLPTGRDLDRAAEDRAKNEAETAREDAEDVWIEGPPTLDGSDEEHFEPPPPPPFPRPSRNTVLAVLLVLLGVLLMAVPRLIGLDDRTGLTLGVLSVLAGGVLLVLRMREARDEDGPDDGAVV
jgi:hypothetical protein